MPRQLNDLTRRVGELAQRKGGATAAEVAEALLMPSRLAAVRLISAMRSMDLHRAPLGRHNTFRYFGTLQEAVDFGYTPPPVPAPTKAKEAAQAVGPYKHSVLELPPSYVSALNPAECRQWVTKVVP